MQKKDTHLPKSKVSHQICNWLRDLGPRHIFLVPGSQIDPLSATIAEESTLETIVTCHELGAGFMADGYSRATGRPGICLGIGGPGAVYMLPSAMVSRVDESPVLFITGDVPTWLKGHFCFQETGMKGSRDRETFRILAGFSKVIDRKEKTRPVLEMVKKRLSANLPAHLVIPHDVQDEASFVTHKTGTVPLKEAEKQDYSDPYEIATVIPEAIMHSRLPIILAGHQLLWEDGPELLKQFAEVTGIHVATTYRAKGVLPEDHPLSIGSFGFAGSKKSFDAILDSTCDLLLLFGAPMNQRNTFDWDFRLIGANRKIIAINSAGIEGFIGSTTNHCLNVRRIPELLRIILSQLSTNGFKSPHSFPGMVNSSSEPSQYLSAFEGHPRLDWALSCLREKVPSETLMFIDSGAHRIVAGTAWKVIRPGTFFTSDIEAPMGWAICAAIGAKAAKPYVPVITLTGDGCMRMLGNEIATAARYRLPVIILVSNNGTYYTTRKRARSETAKQKLGELPMIDWVEYARSLGADGHIVTHPSEFDNAVSLALKSEKPFVIDLRTHPQEPFSSDLTLPAGPWPEPEMVKNRNV